MKLKVRYQGMQIGGWWFDGEEIVELPDTGFVAQYRALCEAMTKIGSDNNFMDLRETGMEEIADK